VNEPPAGLTRNSLRAFRNNHAGPIGVWALVRARARQPRPGALLTSNWFDLTSWVRHPGLPFVEFDAAAGRSLPVFVSRTEAKTPEQRSRFAELAKFVQAGGTAVYLQGGGPHAQWGVGGKASPLLPVSAISKQAIGTWVGVSHLVKAHPVFEGLPVNGMMGAVYENVWAPNTMVNIGGETIAASISYDWFPGYELFKRHYIGPGDTWWGADMAVVPLSKGRCLVSQLRLLENLGKDPVADKILFNLIRFTTKGD
jgi:beta-galactosidase